MTAASWATRRRAAAAPPPTTEQVAPWLPLVWYWVHRCRAATIPPHRLAVTTEEDLFASGCEGLVRALRGFDGTRGVSFKTYASERIRWWILIGAGLTRQGWPPPEVAWPAEPRG